jgi:hypothetical protein
VTQLRVLAPELDYHLYDDLVGCLSFLRLIEDIDAPSWLIRSERNIIPSATLVLIRELLNSSDIFLRKLNLLEVLRNPGRRNRLGNDRVTTDLAPSQDHLRWGGSLLFRDGLDFGTRDEQRDVEEVVAECGIGGDVDILLFGILDELLAG